MAASSRARAEGLWRFKEIPERRTIRPDLSDAPRCRLHTCEIAEGFKRRTKRDKVHFYNMVQGSLEELRYYWILARDLKYLADIQPLMDVTDRCSRLLHGLIASIEQRK